jgi:hypothetical protein
MENGAFLDVINDIRQAVTQNQPLGNSRFYTKIEAMAGQRREPKPRGRQKKQKDNKPEENFNQRELPFDVWWQKNSSLAPFSLPAKPDTQHQRSDGAYIKPPSVHKRFKPRGMPMPSTPK